MDLSNLLEVFLALCQANSGWSLTNKLKLVDWLKALKQVKGFNAMSSLCLWQRFISQRTVQVFTNEMPFESLSTSAIRSLQTFCCPGLSQMRGNKTKRQKQNPITWNHFNNEMQDNKWSNKSRTAFVIIVIFSKSYIFHLWASFFYWLQPPGGSKGIDLLKLSGTLIF